MAVNLIDSQDIKINQTDNDITLETDKTTLNTIIQGKIDEYTTYSTSEEQIVGTWIDGKPIYRKVFTGTITSVSNLKIGTISNFKEAIRIYGITSMNNYSTSITQYWDSSIKFITQINNANGDVYINAGSSSANQLYKAIVEYTKTTD
jgi:hypothetical protein